MTSYLKNAVHSHRQRRTAEHDTASQLLMKMQTETGVVVD